MKSNQIIYVLFSSGNCPDGHFSVDGSCVSCFCAGITKNCKSTGRYRNQISLRFTEEEDFKGTEIIDAYETDRELIHSQLKYLLYSEYLDYAYKYNSA